MNSPNVTIPSAPAPAARAGTDVAGKALGWGDTTYTYGKNARTAGEAAAGAAETAPKVAAGITEGSEVGLRVVAEPVLADVGAMGTVRGTLGVVGRFAAHPLVQAAILLGPHTVKVTDQVISKGYLKGHPLPADDVKKIARRITFADVIPEIDRIVRGSLRGYPLDAGDVRRIARLISGDEEPRQKRPTPAEAPKVPQAVPAAPPQAAPTLIMSAKVREHVEAMHRQLGLAPTGRAQASAEPQTNFAPEEQPRRKTDDLPQFVAKFVVGNISSVYYGSVYGVIFRATYVDVEYRAREAVVQATSLGSKPPINVTGSTTNPYDISKIGRNIVCSPLGVGRLEENPSCAAITSIMPIVGEALLFPVLNGEVKIKSWIISIKDGIEYFPLEMDTDPNQSVAGQWMSIQWRVQHSRLASRYEVQPGLLLSPSKNFVIFR